MNKIGSCTVLYNPDDKVIENINKYRSIIDLCVVVDNSDEKNRYSQEISFIEDIVYINMNGNKGIAAALNTGLKYLLNHGMDIGLTMDQDSIFPTNDYKNIKNIVLQYIENYAIVALNINNKCEFKSNKIVEVPYWLTSGNFVDLKSFERVSGYNEALFIDSVDFEFGYRLYSIGKKICYMQDYSIGHTIGNSFQVKILGKMRTTLNHSPIRYYYRYRNIVYLYGIDKKFFQNEFRKEIFINIPKVLLFEQLKKDKIKFIIKGIRDGIKSHLGPYQE